jgi:transcriptional regulator with XRE-family HTH domain/tetratricopeptide (TPR) repeat protein
MVDETDGKSSAFGKLLLSHRRAAGWTQADLAKASGVSVRALRDLERGRAQAAQQRSAEVLADALKLTGGERELFLTVAKQGRRRTSPSPEVAATCALPLAVPDLVGRDRELARIRAEVAASGAVIAVVGYPGVGKTAVAVSVAHRLRPDFPDGCFAVDLRGMDDQPVTARGALDRLLRALGVAPAQIPVTEIEQSNLFRMLLDGRRVLVLLDNAADEAQVRPLLATGPGCLTLITCRRVLAGLTSARWVWLDPLADSDAVGLLAMIAGAERVDAEPGAAAELVALCGNLPLAVRIAGNRLTTRPHWTLAYLVTQLRDERTRLSSLSAGDLQVRSAFEMSYRRLSPAARQVFRRLAAIPGADFGAELAAVATGMAEQDVRGHLDELADASLVQATSTPGRFQFHDLIRIFAGERQDAEEKPDERDRLSHAVLDHLLAAATAAGLLFFPEARVSSHDDAAQWLDQEGSNWLAAQREAARLGRHRAVLDLAKALQWYSDGHGQRHPWDEIYRLGVTAARALASRHEEAKLLNFLGWAQYFCFGDNEAGRATLEDALAIAVEIGDRPEQAWAHAYLGSVLMRLGCLVESYEHMRQADVLAGEFGFWMERGAIRNGFGGVLRALGRHEEALSVHRGVLADVERHRDDVYPHIQNYFEGGTLQFIGQALLELREWQQAAETFRAARSVYREQGLWLEEANSALQEGNARRLAGAYDEARACLQLALETFTGVTTQSQRDRVLAELELLPGD